MKDLFKDIGSFMIRTPSLPINLLLDNIENTSNMDSMISLFGFSHYKKQFDEAILAASYDLYESMQRYSKEAKEKDTSYLLNTIYKYFSRSCSRCTPFGLFSTVAFGNITPEKTSFELNSVELKREPQVDSNWLFEVIFMYEAKYLKSLKYTMNESAVVYRNKVFLFNCTKNNAGEKINKKSINYSKAFEIVLNISDGFVSYCKIIHKLKSEYPNVDDGILHTYIQSLIKEGYLVSDLRPPLTIKNQLQYFIDKLDEYQISAKTFIDIKKQMENYSDGGSKKINCLLDTFNSMKQIRSSKNYLSIDSSFDYKKCNLNRNEIKKINKLVNLFIQFNVNDTFDKLSDYKSKFLAKYGLSRCVPLIELIDNDMGLGFPSCYDGKSNGNNFNEYVNPWVRFFERKYIEAIRLNQEIEITDADVEELSTVDFDVDILPRSMELYFNYTREDGKDVFQLSNIFGSTYAGKSFGRFSHFMVERELFYRKINSVYGNDDECAFCEFVFLPDSLFTANVIRNMHGSTYEISFGTSNSKDKVCSLKLNEILVGFSNNRFYLKSAINNKRIIPTATNMFNPQLKPQILRLIDDISFDGIRFYNKPWQYLLEKFAYLPTIRYKNFILEQEKWILKLSDLGLAKRFSFDEFKTKFAEYTERLNIPIWVNVVDADKKLLLNLKEDRCLAVLQKFLEKSETILERYNIAAEHPVKFKDISYCCELVIPLVSTTEIATVKNSGFEITKDYDVSVRMQEPLNEWLYFKIYGVEENVDYLLGEVLLEPLKQLCENREIDSYFFIQYKDPERHLRLRLKADKGRLVAVQSNLKHIFSRLMKDSIISSYCIDCYELELERYGGYELMDYAHEVFYRDSLSIQTIIHEKNNGNINVSDELLALTIIFFHMVQFKLSLEEMFIFLDCANNTKHFQEEFKKNRNIYMEFAIRYLTDGNVIPEIDFIIRILSIKNESMEKYLSRIKEIFPDNQTLKFNILDSLLHMNMNRLFGPNVNYERNMRSLARQTYYNVYNRNKKTGILESEKNAKI